MGLVPLQETHLKFGDAKVPLQKALNAEVDGRSFEGLKTAQARLAERPGMSSDSALLRTYLKTVEIARSLSSVL